ncbi:SHOCT domain-containing protein [Halarchaeum sp. P4]|uniref:SHOCT domain-containing protein n=1 Tax=Halarchaeum sp. P4 TaxID=3421639 RepID=UPI003EC03F81
MDDWLKAVLAVLALLVTIPLLAMAFFVPMLYGGMGGMYGDMGMYGPGYRALGIALALLVPLAFLLGLLYVASRLLGSFEDGRDSAALRELEAAYARGDLTTEEYEERRERLE